MWCWLGVDKDSTTFEKTDAPIFRNVALITLGIGGICSLLFHIIIKFDAHLVRIQTLINNAREIMVNNESEEINEYNNSESNQENEDENESSSLIYRQQRLDGYQPMSILDWLCEPQLYHIACLYLFSRLFVNISQAYMPLFLNVTLEMPATYVAIIPMVMYVSGIFMAIVSKSASKCFGIKVACVISCMFGIAGCLWMYQGNTNCNIVLLSK